MANAFDQFDAPAAGVGPSANPFDQFGASGAADPSTTPVYSGSILPMTKYADGHVDFDSHAGVAGMARNFGNTVSNLVSFPHKAMTGEVDPNGPEGIAWGANLASLASPMTPGMMAGDLAIPGVANALRPAKVAIPTAEALHAAGGAGFDAARDMGVDYASPAVASLASGVQDQLNNDGILANLAPKTHAILDALKAVPDAAQGANSVPFGSLDAARKAFGKLGQEFTNPTEQEAAGRAKGAINGFVAAADPGSVVAGPASAAAAQVKDAIANSAAGFRSDKLNGIERAADLSASAVNSGANIGNSTRQRVKSLLLNDKQSAGFDPDETTALEGVVRGSPLANALRWGANAAGGGGGMAHSLVTAGGAGIGAGLGGELGAALGAGVAGSVGPSLKALQNGMDTRALTAADEMTRQRSPLYQALVANAPQVVPSNLKKNALLRAMLLQGEPAPSSQ